MAQVGTTPASQLAARRRPDDIDVGVSDSRRLLMRLANCAPAVIAYGAHPPEVFAGLGRQIRIPVSTPEVPWVAIARKDGEFLLRGNGFVVPETVDFERVSFVTPTAGGPLCEWQGETMTPMTPQDKVLLGIIEKCQKIMAREVPRPRIPIDRVQPWLTAPEGLPSAAADTVPDEGWGEKRFVEFCRLNHLDLPEGSLKAKTQLAAQILNDRRTRGEYIVPVPPMSEAQTTTAPR